MSAPPKSTMGANNEDFKIKNNRLIEPTMYLCAEISKVLHETNKIMLDNVF